MIFGEWEVERDWEREGEARGCEIVCRWVWVGVRVGCRGWGVGGDSEKCNASLGCVLL